MSLLEIKSLKKSFKDLEVLKDISMSVSEGEVVAIIGPSGSGKSTLLRCATLLETMDSGSLAYDGTEVVADVDGRSVYAPKSVISKVKNIFGVVFQSFNLFPHFNALKNVMDAPIHVQKRNPEEVYNEAVELLAKVGLIRSLIPHVCLLLDSYSIAVASLSSLIPVPFCLIVWFFKI